MHTETKRYQCRHIFTDGRRCGSPCLRHEEFCYYHHTTRRPVENPATRRARQSHFDLPLPEDRAAIQLSIGEVLRRIAANEIDPKRAGLLLYGLQIASLNLPREAAPTRANRTEESPFVEEIVADPTYGTLAPRAEVTHRKSVIQTLLENLRDGPDPEPAEEEEEQPIEEQCAEEPGAPRPAFADVGKSPQNLLPVPEVLPTLQACSDSNHPLNEPLIIRTSENIPHRQSPPFDGERKWSLPLCLSGSVKRKAGDDCAVRNRLRLRKPDLEPVRTGIPAASL